MPALGGDGADGLPQLAVLLLQACSGGSGGGASDRQVDKALFKEVGTPEVIDSPINPSDFMESLQFLLTRWRHGAMPKLFNVRQLMIKGKQMEAMKQLTQMVGDPEMMSIIAPTIANGIRGQSDSKVVEKVLLNAIREHPRSLGIILSTIDFYLHAGMPETALKVIAAAKRNHGNPNLLIPEQIQAKIMLNQVEDCIPLLQTLIDADFLPETAKAFLSRCMYAEGHVEGFMNSIGHRVVPFDQFKQAWTIKSGEGA